MQARIEDWDSSSLGLRIPKTLAEQAGIEVGSEIDLSVRDGDLIVRPLQIPRYNLNDLLRGVTPENTHTEIEIGDPVGKEAGSSGGSRPADLEDLEKKEVALQEEAVWKLQDGLFLGVGGSSDK